MEENREMEKDTRFGVQGFRTIQVSALVVVMLMVIVIVSCNGRVWP